MSFFSKYFAGPLVGLSLAFTVHPARAQLAPVALNTAGGPSAPVAVPEPLPFAPGERLEYAVTMARLRLGHGSLMVEESESPEGILVYRLTLEVEIEAPFIRLVERETSWIGTEPFRSLAFERYRKEGGGEERTRLRFDHSSLRYSVEEWDDSSGDFLAATGPEAGGAIPVGAIDEIAALYLLRTLSLEPGLIHRLSTYYDPAGNPIVFRVLGRETVKVPAGRFEVVVIEPDIPSLAPFRVSAGPRIYVTDDARRLIVKITTRTRAGTLTFYLKELPDGED